MGDKVGRGLHGRRAERRSFKETRRRLYLLGGYDMVSQGAAHLEIGEVMLTVGSYLERNVIYFSMHDRMKDEHYGLLISALCHFTQTHAVPYAIAPMDRTLFIHPDQPSPSVALPS